MHVKEFAETVASIASEIHCDGGQRIASHNIPSSVTIETEHDVFDVVSVEADRLMGCGCWCGIRIVVKKVA